VLAQKNRAQILRVLVNLSLLHSTIKKDGIQILLKREKNTSSQKHAACGGKNAKDLECLTNGRYRTNGRQEHSMKM